MTGSGREIRLHRYTSGKLIGGSDPEGPIVKGAGYEITGQSEGFPDALIPLCDPIRFFSTWTTLSLMLDRDWLPEGAFLYRPVIAGDRKYGIFGRLSARLEDGVGMRGRRYSHFSALIVDLDDWCPSLPIYMYAFLFQATRQDFDPDDPFDGAIGGPDFDEDTGRLNKPQIRLPYEQMIAPADLKANEPAPDLWQTTGQGVDLGVSGSQASGSRPLYEIARQIELLSAHLGAAGYDARALSFSVGLAPGIDGAGDGFALEVTHGLHGIEGTPALTDRFMAGLRLTAADFDTRGELVWRVRAEPLAAPPRADPAHAALGQAWRGFQEQLINRQTFPKGVFEHFADLIRQSLETGDETGMAAFRRSLAYTRLLEPLELGKIRGARRDPHWTKRAPDGPAQGCLVDVARILAHLGNFQRVREVPAALKDLVIGEDQLAELALRLVNALWRMRPGLGSFQSLAAVLVFMAHELPPERRSCALELLLAAFDRYWQSKRDGLLRTRGQSGADLENARALAAFLAEGDPARLSAYLFSDLTDRIEGDTARAIRRAVMAYPEPALAEIIAEDRVSLGAIAVRGARFGQRGQDQASSGPRVTLMRPLRGLLDRARQFARRTVPARTGYGTGARSNGS